MLVHRLRIVDRLTPIMGPILALLFLALDKGCSNKTSMNISKRVGAAFECSLQFSYFACPCSLYIPLLLATQYFQKYSLCTASKMTKYPKGNSVADNCNILKTRLRFLSVAHSVPHLSASPHWQMPYYGAKDGPNELKNAIHGTQLNKTRIKSDTQRHPTCTANAIG